jgi:hypothetical protein
MHSMRDLYPIGAVVGITIGVMLYAAIGYHYVEWLFYWAAAVIVFLTMAA